METIIPVLTKDQVVLDLGSGPGSFNYDQCSARIIAADLHVNRMQHSWKHPAVNYICIDAGNIPLKTAAIDAVFCNHTLEHFLGYQQTLREIGRILKPTGAIWISVPDGYGFDDWLYRYIYEGGGHVQRYRGPEFSKEVVDLTGCRLAQSIPLFSGFQYLKYPSPAEIPHLQLRAKMLLCRSAKLNIFLARFLGVGARLCDLVFRTHLSRYGWGFVFLRGNFKIEPMTPYFNVCWNCGSGQHPNYLRHLGLIDSCWGLKFFTCPSCRARNYFFKSFPSHMWIN